MTCVLYVGTWERIECIVQPTHPITNRIGSFILVKRVIKIVRKWKRGATILVIIMLFAGVLVSPPLALAAPTPDTTIDINNSTGPFSGNLVLNSTDLNYIIGGRNAAAGAWFPGLAKSGTIRIINNHFYKVKVKSLALEISGIPEDKRVDFNQNMLLSMKKGSNLIFPDPPIITEQSFSLFAAPGIPLTLEIPRLGYVDLEVTVKMFQDAPLEMMGLNPSVSLRFSTEEVPAPPSDSGGGGSSPGSISFFISDVGPQYWAYGCIQALLRNGEIDLEPDNKIRPEDYLTRAEAAVLIAKAKGLAPKDKLLSGYLDPLPDWARGYIIAVSEAGYFNGYPGWLFKPANGITREELTCVLVRAFDKKLNGDITLGFTDSDKISAWALNSVKTGVQQGVIGGYPDNSFRPTSYITRAEAFSIMCRLLGYHNAHN